MTTAPQGFSHSTLYACVRFWLRVRQREREREREKGGERERGSSETPLLSFFQQRFRGQSLTQSLTHHSELYQKR
jgi:hypothetical protein